MVSVESMGVAREFDCPGSREHSGTAARSDALTEQLCTEVRLRAELADQKALLRRKDEMIDQLKVLAVESDHRMLNSLQLVQSLLRLQSRGSANAETASELAAAANRVAMIGRVHRRLHYLEGERTIAFAEFLEGLCRDLSEMMASAESAKHVECITTVEVVLPTNVGVPLGHIANELITNALKHGHGRITARLEEDAEKGYALSVDNEGPRLPEGFDPAACKGLGMKIVRSLVGVIDGELRNDRGEKNEGTRFTVLFSR